MTTKDFQNHLEVKRYFYMATLAYHASVKTKLATSSDSFFPQTKLLTESRMDIHFIKLSLFSKQKRICSIYMRHFLMFSFGCKTV